MSDTPHVDYIEAHFAETNEQIHTFCRILAHSGETQQSPKAIKLLEGALLQRAASERRMLLDFIPPDERVIRQQRAKEASVGADLSAYQYVIPLDFSGAPPEVQEWFLQHVQRPVVNRPTEPKDGAA